MGDQILIKDLLLRAIIGVNDEERRNLQDVLLNIVLEVDTRAAGATDDMAYAVNYRTVTKRIIRMVEQNQFFLVEKLAAEIAALCLGDPRVQLVHVCVEKPGALRYARSVGVSIERRREELLPPAHRALIALGSNLDPELHLRAAVLRLTGLCHVLAVSPVYSSAPVDTSDQPPFLNAAAAIETNLTPEVLKTEVLERIEQELGRVRDADKFGPRTIDLDLAFYDDVVLTLDQGHIPHRDVLLYPHVARPLADIAASYRHPETGQTLADLAAGLADAGLTLQPDIVLWRP